MSYEAVDEATRKHWNEECKYEEHYIAFLDILGFSELVYDETFNSTFVGILGSTSTLPNQEIAKDTPFARVKTAIISDTIVISALMNSPTALEDILYVIRSIFLSFLHDGVLIRGAICCGKLFHQDNIVFGPAMVEAHELERSVAIYPRIVIKSGTEPSFFGANQQLMGKFVQDTDGIPYLDLYSEVIVHSYRQDDSHGPQMIRNLVAKHLGTPKTKERIRQKYLWVREHFNTSLEEQLAAKRISLEVFKAWVLQD